MKLNHDCIRDFMIYFEKNVRLNEELSYSDLDLFEKETKYSSEDIIYTIQKLSEANYINAQFYQGSNAIYNLSVSAITWEGHQFLDTIRDNKVWKNTKTVVSKFSSVSITLLKEVASTILIEMINKQINQP